jgi:acyl-CoA thioester hydrolase
MSPEAGFFRIVMTRRRKRTVFKREPGDPLPLSVTVSRRVAFHEVDAMGVAWHGHYAKYFEEASSEARRNCGLTYEAFREANLRAPIIRFHVEHFNSLLLDEKMTVTASMIWTEAARLNTEYEILKENGLVAATGYTVQLFTDGTTGEPCLTPPGILEESRKQWRERHP